MSFIKTAIVIALCLPVFCIPASGQKGEEIIRQERFFYDSLKEKNLSVLPDLFLDNFHGVFGGGYIDRDAEIKGFESAVLLDYRFSEIVVKFPAENVGIMMYRSFIKGTSKGLEVTGDAYRTSTWVKSGGKWKMILHTDVPVGETLANINKRKNDKNMKFIGLATSIYKVSDLDKAKEWYSKAFGVKPYFDEPFYVGFNVNGFELGLQTEDENSSTKGNASMCYWAVNDAEAAFKEFIALGATEHEAPADVGGGVVVASVKDPWGNIIGIIHNPVFTGAVN